MNVKYYPAHLSALIIDDDLAMGAHGITLGDAQTVDGKDVSTLDVGDMKKSTYDTDDDDHVDTFNIAASASDVLCKSMDGVVGHYTTSYTKVKTINIPPAYINSGTYRIKFSIQGNTSTMYGRIYKNGVAHGTERTKVNTGYEEFSEDLVFDGDDTIELWLKASNTNGGSCKNFRVYCDKVYTDAW